MAKKTDLYIGIFLLGVAALNILGLLKMIGIGQKFVDIVVVLTAVYLIVKGVK